MMNSTVEYNINTTSETDIYKHLLQVNKCYVVPLSQRVNLKDYALKLYNYAQRLEAWSGQALVGLIAFYENIEHQEFFITNVSVLPEYNGLGIASSMITWLKQLIVKSTCQKITLKADFQVVGFYTKNGFKIISETDVDNEMYLSWRK